MTSYSRINPDVINYLCEQGIYINAQYKKGGLRVAKFLSLSINHEKLDFKVFAALMSNGADARDLNLKKKHCLEGLHKFLEKEEILKA